MKRLICPVILCLLIPAGYAAENTKTRTPSRSRATPIAATNVIHVDIQTNVTLQDFKLTGDLSGDRAGFTLTATAQVESPKGGTLELLEGTVALTEVGPHPHWALRAEPNRFVAVFDRAGKFPIRIKFDAVVRDREGWKSLDFRIAPSALQPIVLKGLVEETKFDFAGAARPERKGDEFVSYLPSDGAVKLSWKQARTETEGKLFYSAEMLSQVSVSPGLMRQVALLNFKVMQGELSRVTVLLRGTGEVTRVQGEQVLAWNVEPGTNASERRLIVQLNQPQKDRFAVQVQAQTPLGAFPQSAEVVQVRPEAATRFAGYFRIVNEGAVRLEVSQASGLSQISPEQFPESDATKAALKATGSQRFAYRFSGMDFALKIQADQVLPELSISEVLAYRLAENEQTIDAEIELDIREAPLRELLLRVPRAYAIARLNASGLSDYFVHELDDQAESELRLVYGQPVSGRQLIELRLERNKALGESTWALPRIEVPKAKSVRGHVGVAADAGFRLTAERTQGLTEIATAFFPRKAAGIQAAFRLSEASWQAALRVERLPQTVQVDGFHLFSIGEGIAYGSSMMNYVVSGAPVSAFRIELSSEYYNVEFTGKDIRNWQKTEGGYVVQLHTPVSGAYTLLATYERPFKSQGETLTFTGARPLDAQSEQGHTVIISGYQLKVEPQDVSSGLLRLETREVPAEYRLFFDAPILAAYRYSSRPFNLKLALSPLAQGDSISQVVDRASLTNRISKEGQILTEARYFVKNRGNPNFRMRLPAGTELWSATVNGAAVVPVIDGDANLIPLPQRIDPNAVLTLDLKLASLSKDSRQVTIEAPRINAPVMLMEWTLEPDARQRLVYRSGSLTPLGGVVDVSGFAGIARVFSNDQAGHAAMLLIGALLLAGAAMVLWRWGSQDGLYKFSGRHLAGTGLGLAAFIIALCLFASFGGLVADQSSSVPRGVTMVAPVQEAGSPLKVEISNLPDKASVMEFLRYAWPAIAAVAVWIYGWATARNWFKRVGWVLGWLLLAWAALRSPNGGPIFVGILVLYILIHAIAPMLGRLWRLPRQPAPEPETEGGAASAAVTALLLGGLAWFTLGCAGMEMSGHAAVASTNQVAVAESVVQEIRVEDKFALATMGIHWTAVKGQRLPLLFEPAVLTQLTYPSNALKLAQVKAGPRRIQELIAEREGVFDLRVRYELRVTKRENESGFNLPVQYGLINRLKLAVVDSDVEVYSPQAVSVERETSGSNTVATLVLSPAAEAWIGWKPRSRDVRKEKTVFYAEVSQLYAPAAGVIEGAHYVSIRPAQGELNELVVDVPRGATVTDVYDPASQAGDDKAGNAHASVVSLWRFDPDTRKLRVKLNPAQSRPFALVVRTQVASGPLPFEESVGLVSVEGAAGQIGMLGIATGNEVQLDGVNAPGLSPINLEDFPGEAQAALHGQVSNLTLRRAFRYSDSKASVTVKSSAVEPDVRVETQDTLSLGEDRTVLAANVTVTITRAGIFRLSFLMPAGYDVETISGAALSHWTELKDEAGRVITLHLKGKTEGQQQFVVSLAGPGRKPVKGWSVPQMSFREANKQRGTLLVVPEQGMRLQVGEREGLTQLDPQKSGIRQKGVLAFRMLQTPWRLALDVEQVDPWIQVTGLQHATINEAQIKIVANLHYQIENTGLKAFRIWMPTNAEGVRFQGDQLSDFLAVEGAVTNGLQQWEVKLHRRVIGSYLLQASYQIPLPEKASETVLRGVQAADVNLQRGFVTIQSGGRLQVQVDATPESLQPTEWQSIPHALQQDLQTATANLAYRLVDPAFQLPLKLERHEAAILKPARVNNITFTSVISDDGVALTLARIEMLPGDKRLLQLTLPQGGQFWFAFVNQNGVWPWRDKDKILIPLDQQSPSGKPTPVEVFYSCHAGSANPRALDLNLLAPKFDLPLENIAWRVSLSDKWQVKHWTGTLQLESEREGAGTTATDAQSYLSNETNLQRERTREAEGFLAAGNAALQAGEPQQARKAFQAAYGLSGHDAAFNEDARVQLHNIKLQQALVGLNVRQATAAGDTSGLGTKLRDLRARKDANYTQQDAKDIIDRNTADENNAFMRLAERLIQQQDAAVSSPAAIRASIPEQGRVLTFRRSVAVDDWADLRIGLEAKAARDASWGVRVLILAATLLLMGGFWWTRMPERS